MSTKLVITGIVALLMIVGGFIALQEQNTNEMMTLRGLVTAINKREVSEIEKQDTKMIIRFTNNELQTIESKENNDSLLANLRNHGAREEQLHAIEFRYVGSNNLSFYPIMPLVIAFIYTMGSLSPSYLSSTIE